MARTTRITGPDGSVTTLRTTSSFGCVTLFLVLIVVGIPAALFGSWALPAYLGLVAVIVVAIAILARKGWTEGKRMRGQPLDPEKDAAYWAEYVAQVSGNPPPPPV